MTAPERAYYDRRAAEYDDWYRGAGLYAERERPGWREELATLQATLAALRFHSILDAACGTGFLTECLQGTITGLDQSASMLAVARSRLPGASLVRGDALALPFRSMQFDCLLAGHFYGHLDERARQRFREEARRVSRKMLVVDAARRDEVPAEEYQHRVLNDGSRHVVYKRYFTPEQLIEELGTGQVLHAGRWFVAVLA
jgi:demethylmenaquinone methyltransferase/2-methoxy-6-polyprenyl-1,4-benzoquinol methylase